MRTLTIVLLFLVATAAFGQQPLPEPVPELLPEPLEIPYTETIFVVRYALDVRVTDSYGKAIEDLKPEDFVVRIGKKNAEVVQATWMAQGHSPKPLRGGETADQPLGDDLEVLPEDLPVVEQPEPPRSIVLFIQTDIARVKDRVLGQMKFNYMADDILAMLGPNDRVAVLSHDSHLKFRRDFTFDRESILKAVRESLYTDVPPPPARTTEGSSLTGLLDPKEMKKAAHAEAALLVIAKALHAIDGPKSIILAGWGIGELQGRAGVQLKPEWHQAVGILYQDHVPVIVLDTGLQAQLMAGLKATAAATGGMYTSQDFKDQALGRVEGALAGHYALSLRIDDALEPGQYPLTVSVKRKDTYVQAPSFVLQGH